MTPGSFHQAFPRVDGGKRQTAFTSFGVPGMTGQEGMRENTRSTVQGSDSAGRDGVFILGGRSVQDQPPRNYSRAFGVVTGKKSTQPVAVGTSPSLRPRYTAAPRARVQCDWQAILPPIERIAWLVFLVGAAPLTTELRSMTVSRRQLIQGALGLAAVGAGELLLHPQARATPGSGTLGAYADLLAREAKGALDAPQGPEPLVATEDNILG